MRSRTLLVMLSGLALLTPPSLGQRTNPTYVDDSPAAADTLAQLPRLMAAGNAPEAARSLRNLLEREGDRVVASESDADLFVGVRERVHRVLLDSPELLEEYRNQVAPIAASMLEAGRVEEVERACLLTPAGFEAALRKTQQYLEAGAFDAALICLKQLEEHPDRREVRGAREAAGLAQAIARYVQREDARELARQWCAEAAVPFHDAPSIEPPALVRQPVFEPLATGVRPRASEIPPTPLWSVPLVPPEQLLAAQPNAALWMFPVAAGPHVIVNDGVSVRAFDRYTLEPRWTTADSSADEPLEQSLEDVVRFRGGQNLAAIIEDVNTVAIAGRVVIAVTGMAASSGREGDPRVHAIDLDTGRRIWSVDVSQEDPRLTDGSVRGPPVVSGSTVVVAVKKDAAIRRTMSTYLVGLDLASGTLVWVRQIGSAGTLPWNTQSPTAADAPVVVDGIVYISDRIGLHAAVEAATGRVRWIRRIAPPNFVALPPNRAWETRQPIVHDEHVYTLTSDLSMIVKLDRQTGKVVGRRPSSLFDNPSYLVRSGEWLVAVAPSRLAFIRIDDFDSGRVTPSERFPGALRSRVIAAGDRVLAPMADAVLVFDPAAPAAVPERIPLASTGTILAAPDQLIVVDDRALYSYVTVEVAERELTQRMAGAPDDPAPAVKYADFAFRAGLSDRIGAAAANALRIIDSDPLSTRSLDARTRLFGVLREAIDSALVERPASGAPRLSPSEVAELLPLLGRSATTSEQRVAYLMASGRHHEMSGEPVPAVEAYQSVLSDPALAGVEWSDRSLTVRADFEATRRVRAVIRSWGNQAYAPFAAECRALRDAMPTDAGTGEIEALARRYPGVSAFLWIEAARRYERAARTRHAAAAWSSALAAAESAYAAGVLDEGTNLAEAAGSLVLALEAAGRVSSAAQTLNRIVNAYPEIIPTTGWIPIDAPTLAADLSRRLGAVDRLPSIGLEFLPDIQVIRGAMLMRPEIHAGSMLASEHAVLISRAEREVSIWGADQSLSTATEGRGADAPWRLTRLWARSYARLEPALLRSDPEAVYFLWPNLSGAEVERVDVVGGRTRWRTGPFSSFFEADPEYVARILDQNQIPVRITTPHNGIVPLTQIIASIDAGVVALVERGGRVLALDAETGQPLSTTTTPVIRVYDAAASGGRIILAGLAGPIREDGTGTPMVLILDAATGREVSRVANLTEPPQWLRVADGRIVLSAREGLVCLSLDTGERLWVAPDPAGAATRETWALGDHLFILTPEGQLYAASMIDGRIRDGAIETGGRLNPFSLIAAARIGRRFAFMSSSGLVLVDESGETVGIDSLRAGNTLLPPVPTERFFLAISTQGYLRPDGLRAYDIHALSSESTRILSTRPIVLGGDPVDLRVLDGRVVLTAGGVTQVLFAPAEEP